MRLLCVQCLKVNDVEDDAETDANGKVRVECPACGFVTVITRRAPGQAQAPSQKARTPTPPPKPPPTNPQPANDGAGESGETTSKNLYKDLFDAEETSVGDWMVRHLDGTEVGPITFDEIREMISSGQLGKIDEVRKLDERYVPAAFHEATAELFNELETTGI